MNKDFILNSGKRFHIRCVTGTVISNTTWSETQIKSTQNPGYVSSSGIMVGGGTNVRSTTVEKADVWLRTDDGKEECFRLNHNVLQTREGHRLSILVGAVAEKEPNVLLAIYQFNNEKLFDFTQSNRGGGILLSSGLKSIWMEALRWAFYCGCVAFIMGIPLIPIVAFLVHRNKKNVLKELSSHIGGMVESAKAAEMKRAAVA